MDRVTSSDLYAAGYAVPLYTISRTERAFRYRGEEFTVPMGSVTVTEYRGWPVARLEDVRAAAEKTTASYRNHA